MKTLFIKTLLILSFSLPAVAEMVDNPLLYTVNVNTLELLNNSDKSIAWDSYAWVGYDLNKVYIYSEGEKPKNGLSESENQLVYSRAITPYWDIQLGVGYDKSEESNKKWGVIGVQGLAPYFFEVRTVMLVGEDGNIGIRAEAEYEALITQKLILTPSLALSAYTKDSVEMGIGSGLSNLTIGARLRYEFVREFAPYIGVEWSKNFDNTNVYTPLDEVYATAGLKFWF